MISQETHFCENKLAMYVLASFFWTARLIYFMSLYFKMKYCIIEP